MLIPVLSREYFRISGYSDNGIGVIFSNKCCHDNYLDNVHPKNDTASLDMWGEEEVDLGS